MSTETIRPVSRSYVQEALIRYLSMRKIPSLRNRCAAAGVLAAVLFSGAAFAAPSANGPGASAEAELKQKLQAATQGFKDLTLSVRITYQNQAELEKIGQDFGLAYKFSNSTLEFKSPDKFKMTARAGLMNVTYLVTGTIKRVKAGFINKTEDISGKPHKRQSALDVGLLDTTVWKLFKVESVTKTRDDDRPVYLMILSRSNAPAKKIRLYVDASQLRLMKRENFEADGSLIARYLYKKHRAFDGIPLPMEISVYSRDGKLAGTSEYTSVKMNSGIPDSVFK